MVQGWTFSLPFQGGVPSCMGVLFFVEVLGVKGGLDVPKVDVTANVSWKNGAFWWSISYENMWRKIMFDHEHPHNWRGKRYTMMIQQIFRQGNHETHSWVISWWNWSPRFTPKATVTTVASPRAAQSLADSDASGPTVVYLAKFLAADLENLVLTGVWGVGKFRWECESTRRIYIKWKKERTWCHEVSVKIGVISSLKALMEHVDLHVLEQSWTVGRIFKIRTVTLKRNTKGRSNKELVMRTTRKKQLTATIAKTGTGW